eukprot:2762091-Prymnesium_polylepis.1
MVEHYPESMHCIYFYRPSVVFRAVFNVFRLWVPRRRARCGPRPDAPVRLGGAAARAGGLTQQLTGWVRSRGGRRTREKFVLVREGEEHLHFLAADPASTHGCAPQVLPAELGGSGPQLDGDRFMLRAIGMYDATPRREQAEAACGQTAGG